MLQVEISVTANRAALLFIMNQRLFCCVDLPTAPYRIGYDRAPFVSTSSEGSRLFSAHS